MEIFDLKRFRVDKKLTQKKLAEMLDCEQPFISKIEKNERSFPDAMKQVLQSKYGNITEYITEKEDLVIKGTNVQEFMEIGADAFVRQTVKMMNDKLIAPYGLLEEKEKEIANLYKKIGSLEAQIEILKKDIAQRGGDAICAAAK